MPWSPCPRQAAGGVLALEASRFVRACSVFDGSQRSSPGRFAGRSFRVRDYGRRGPCTQLGVELDASTCIRILSICTSVWVPLTDILDTKLDGQTLSVRDQLAFNKKIELKVAQLASATKVVVSPDSVQNVNAVTTRGGKTTHDPPYPNHKTGRPPRQQEET